jgi:hypothetical protein
MTRGYPYFVQKLFSIIYEHKFQNPGSVSDLSEVKKEYGNSFRETVKGWVTPNMPQRTLRRLKELSATMIKQVGDNTLKVIFKGIEELLKAQIIT